MSDSIGQNYALTIPNNYTQKLYRVTIPNITRPNRPRTHHLKRINIAEKGGRSTYPPTLPRYPFSKGDRDATNRERNISIYFVSIYFYSIYLCVLIRTLQRSD